MPAKNICPACAYSTAHSGHMTKHLEKTRHGRPIRRSNIGKTTLGRGAKRLQGRQKKGMKQ